MYAQQLLELRDSFPVPALVPRPPDTAVDRRRTVQHGVQFGRLLLVGGDLPRDPHQVPVEDDVRAREGLAVVFDGAVPRHKLRLVQRIHALHVFGDMAYGLAGRIGLAVACPSQHVQEVVQVEPELIAKRERRLLGGSAERGQQNQAECPFHVVNTTQPEGG